ncbi:hypothetical protein C8Q79DRAFT_770141 [Trametes meyenii]|nr:hypothetical protein C8Q79DRAFT_770141 [Trametes meyenii]
MAGNDSRRRPLFPTAIFVVALLKRLVGFLFWAINQCTSPTPLYIAIVMFDSAVVHCKHHAKRRPHYPRGAGAAVVGRRKKYLSITLSSHESSTWKFLSTVRVSGMVGAPPMPMPTWTSGKLCSASHLMVPLTERVGAFLGKSTTKACAYHCWRQARRGSDRRARADLSVPHILACYARVPSTSHHACRRSVPPCTAGRCATQPAKLVQQMLQSAGRHWVLPAHRVCESTGLPPPRMW